MKPIRLVVNGVKLHERFSRMVLDALDHMEPAPAFPPIPKGYSRFQASDNSIHAIPRKHLAQARRIDPGLALLGERSVMNTQGSGSFAVTTARPRSQTKLTRAEREVLRTLYFLALV